jgi:hypothetical protein
MDLEPPQEQPNVRRRLIVAFLAYLVPWLVLLGVNLFHNYIVEKIVLSPSGSNGSIFTLLVGGLLLYSPPVLSLILFAYGIVSTVRMATSAPTAEDFTKHINRTIIATLIVVAFTFFLSICFVGPI